MPNLTIFSFLGLLVRGGSNPLPPKIENPCFWPKIKSKGCFGLGIAHWFQPKSYFFRFLPFRPLNQGGFEPTTPRDEIPCFWPKIKSKGCFGLGIAHWFQPKPYFFRFFPFRLWNQGGGLIQPTPEMKIRVFGQKSKVRGVLDLALHTDISPSLIFSNFYHSDLKIRG